ncbi:P-type ATPase [Sesbania bispinosa]|nr:P-type ATPase [Sesbania bispinosa]
MGVSVIPRETRGLVGFYRDVHSQIGQKGYSRVVYCNDPDNPDAIQLNYRGNYVSTTKYTAFNFIPKSLFEQFRRVANIYFLIVACVSFSPLAPFTALSIVAPLLVVIGATMVKEAVEDWRRRKQDIEANNRKVQVYGRNYTFVETRWKKLRVGDIIKVNKDEYFPADLLLLSSSYEDGVCYVETMNLDGETNLKLKHALEVTTHLQNEKSLQKFRAMVKCEDPNENLYSFIGTLQYEGGIPYGRGMTEVEKALARRGKMWNLRWMVLSSDFLGQNSDAVDSKRPIKGFNFRDERIMSGQWVNEPQPDIIQKFFRVLAICHTAIPEEHKDSGEISYEAESPDEAAFVIAAKELGFEFFARTQTSISLHELNYGSGKKVDRFESVDTFIHNLAYHISVPAFACVRVQQFPQKNVRFLNVIEKLAQAGIKLWVLTGDKMETAVNIGYACSLLRQDMKKIVITLDSPDILSLEKQGDKEALAKLVLEVLKHYNHINQICRFTKLVKLGTGKTTLSIGDGANDVGMLQEADIGVGISGAEGMQAVMASDFAIAQFRFLERLLLVHGHWCYRRISMMICYFFYKNIAFGFTLFWFEAYASFSGQAAYNDWYMSFYNVFFTSLPVIALGVFDQDVSARLCLKGVEGTLFSWPRILGWMLNGVLSSLAIFFLTTNSVLSQAFRRDGQMVDFEILGVTMYTCVVWTVNCQMALSINYFTWIQHFFIWGSIAFWYVFVLIYGYLSPAISTTAYMVFVEACAPSGLYWLVTLLVVVCVLLPYFCYRSFQSRFLPMYHDIIQRKQVEGSEIEISDELPQQVQGKLIHLRERLKQREP